MNMSVNHQPQLHIHLADISIVFLTDQFCNHSLSYNHCDRVDRTGLKSFGSQKTLPKANIWFGKFIVGHCQELNTSNFDCVNVTFKYLGSLPTTLRKILKRCLGIHPRNAFKNFNINDPGTKARRPLLCPLISLFWSSAIQ